MRSGLFSFGLFFEKNTMRIFLILACLGCAAAQAQNIPLATPKKAKAVMGVSVTVVDEVKAPVPKKP